MKNIRTPNTMVPMESGPHWVWLPDWKGVCGVTVKGTSWDEALMAGTEKAAIMPCIRRFVILELFVARLLSEFEVVAKKVDV